MHKYTLKIDRLRNQRGWSVYKLAQEAGLSPQTIYKWLESNTVPMLSAIELCCKAFNTTLSEFFADGKLIESSPRISNLYKMWCIMTPDEQASVEAIVKNYANNKKVK